MHCPRPTTAIAVKSRQITLKHTLPHWHSSLSGTGGERHRMYQTPAEPAKVAQADNTFGQRKADQILVDPACLTAEPASCGAGFWRRANRQPWFQPTSGCSQPTGAD